MLHTTRGIVFHHVKYSESSVIARIYTELFGLQSYMIRGIRNKKSTIKSALLQHLTLVDLVVYHKTKSNIQNIKEIKIAYPFNSIPYNIYKSSIAVFLNEILYHVIKEEEANVELFKFLFNSIQILDLNNEAYATFHYFFLVQLTKYLGFFPKNNFSDKNCNFNLEEGNFTSQKGPQNIYISQPFSYYIAQLSNLFFEDMDEINIWNSHKSELLEIILNYYRLHLPISLNIKSHQILQTVFND
jgi:DNA repair protein RecO (recombination protein O)